MRNKTKIQANQSSDDNILLEFNNVKFFVIVNSDVYNDECLDKIQYIVDTLSKQIYVDKSYVDFPENRHCDVFLELEGWQIMCKLIKRTKYGKISVNSVDDILCETFKTILLAYMYSTLEKFGYDIENIQLDIINGDKLSVKFYKDTVQEWKYYPGPWQDWGLEDSER